MLDHEDLKWVAATSTNLNSMLQQIARYTDLARRHPETRNYINLVGERVELASKTAQALFDRITSNILENTAMRAAQYRKGAATPFTVLPPPMSVRPDQTAASFSQLVSSPAASHPAAKPASAGQEPLPADLNVRNSNGSRELILLVEDEQEVAEMGAQILIAEGYKVIVANDGFEALKIYQRAGNHIGLIILDFFLPVMDGDAVFDELRALNPDVNVVLSSGFAEQQKVSSMLAQGLRGFVPKPYTREKILFQIRSTLDSAKQPTPR